MRLIIDRGSRKTIQGNKGVHIMGRYLMCPVTDHIIVAGGTGLHTSIRSSNPELFSPLVAENKRVSVKEKIAEKKAMIADKIGKPKEKSRELAK